MKYIFGILLLFSGFNTFSQSISSDNKSIERAFALAIKTVDDNTRDGILAAGADYGGEWTRDISINSWNGASLLRPGVAEASLWSVTIDKDTVGHQYWDKIIWVIAAYNHYLVTGDKNFLGKAYQCSINTMEQLELTAFDKKYNLFTGPSVFNDGIAGYPEPVFEPGNKSSYVLDHKGSDRIKCLSTNAIYYGAYNAILRMQQALGKSATAALYQAKSKKLKNSILQHFYNKQQHKFNYLVDQNGKVDHSQEGLGISFAVLFGIVEGEDARLLIKNASVSAFGITSIYPDFPRYSRDKPGRHNNIVWPMVNGFFARAALLSGNTAVFSKELQNLARLALEPGKGNNDFKEIYNAYTGQPDGGWQANGTDAEHHWTSCKAQTWSATAFMSMLINGVAGFNFKESGLVIRPYLPSGMQQLSLKGIPYRKASLNIDIKGKGKTIKSFVLDGKVQKKDFIIDSDISGQHSIAITVE